VGDIVAPQDPLPEHHLGGEALSALPIRANPKLDSVL